MEIGIDLIEISKLQEIISRTPSFLSKVLTNKELENISIQTIAGKIATKEAIIKTGYCGAGEWQKIQILSDKDGKPHVYSDQNELIKELKVSISHTDTYAIAMALLC